MSTSLETSPSPNLLTEQDLIGVFQELALRDLEIEGLNYAARLLDDEVRSLTIPPDTNEMGSNVEMTNEELARIGLASIYSIRTRAAERDVYRQKHVLEGSMVLNESGFAGRLAVVRAIDPDSKVIERSTRSKWDGNMKYRGYVPEATARIGTNPYDSYHKTLNLYVTRRLRSRASECYNVKVVDNSANPLVEIKFLDK